MNLFDAQELATYLEVAFSTSTERHEFIKSLAYTNDSGKDAYPGYVLAHLYDHGEDIPPDPEYGCRYDDQVEGRINLTHVSRESEAGVDVEEQQQRLFGGWDWAKAAGRPDGRPICGSLTPDKVASRKIIVQATCACRVSLYYNQRI